MGEEVQRVLDTFPIRREEHLILEEIRDLKDYLGGLPETVKAGGALAAYEKRLTLLQQELVATRLQTIAAPSLASESAVPAQASPAKKEDLAAGYLLALRDELETLSSDEVQLTSKDIDESIKRLSQLFSELSKVGIVPAGGQA
jgi:hypothetical protein